MSPFDTPLKKASEYAVNTVKWGRNGHLYEVKNQNDQNGKQVNVWRKVDKEGASRSRAPSRRRRSSMRSRSSSRSRSCSTKNVGECVRARRCTFKNGRCASKRRPSTRKKTTRKKTKRKTPSKTRYGTTKEGRVIWQGARGGKFIMRKNRRVYMN
jgi:hypothetical protein